MIHCLPGTVIKFYSALRSSSNVPPHQQRSPEHSKGYRRFYSSRDRAYSGDDRDTVNLRPAGETVQDTKVPCENPYRISVSFHPLF